MAGHPPRDLPTRTTTWHQLTGRRRPLRFNGRHLDQLRVVERYKGTAGHLRSSGHPLHPALSPAVLTQSCHRNQRGKGERVRLTICATLPHFNPTHAQVMCQHSSPPTHPTLLHANKSSKKNDTHNTLKALRRLASGEATGVGALAVVVVNLHEGGSDHRVALLGPEQQ